MSNRLTLCNIYMSSNCFLVSYYCLILVVSLIDLQAVEFNNVVQGASAWLSDVETKVENLGLTSSSSSGEEDEQSLQQTLDELDVRL